MVHPHVARFRPLRSFAVLGALALVVLIPACGPGSPRLPEPAWTEDYGRHLPEAVALCEAASSAAETGGAPEAPWPV